MRRNSGGQVSSQVKGYVTLHLRQGEKSFLWHVSMFFEFEVCAQQTPVAAWDTSPNRPDPGH